MIFDFKEMVEAIRQSNTYYNSFIDAQNMDIGILVLKPGEEDIQKPHTKDEIYFILQGDGYMVIDKENVPIKEKTFYLIKKNTFHKFFSNKKEIIAIYFLGC